jgi:NodT family efflux transporter outer membrane factor (OMF) lipoprotein
MKKYFALLLTTTLLAGCNWLNPYERPDTPVPEKWSEAPQAQESGKTAAEQTPQWPPLDWWTQFHSPRLDALMKQAQEANFDLKAAVARVHEADAQVRISGAVLLPGIDLGADATRSKNGSGRTGTTATAPGSRISNSYSARLSAAYELDFWGRNQSAFASARALAKASRYDEQTVALTVTSDLANTYFAVVGLTDRLAIARADLEAAQKLLTDIKKRYAQGLASGLDVAQQENLVAAQQATLPPVELQLRQQTNALAVLLGVLPESLQLQPEDKNLDGIAIPAVSAGLPSELLLRRPDVQYAEAQLIAAHADINAARAAFFPDIALTGDGGYASGALGNLFRSGNLFYALGASLAQPIFHGGELLGELQLNKARYDELLQNYRKTAISAFSDVENALAAVKQTAAQQQAQQDAARSAKTAFDMSQRQFREGYVDILTVLNTQRSFFSAQDALLQVKLAHIQAVVGLYRALGGGWKAGEASQPPAAPSAVINGIS